MLVFVGMYIIMMMIQPEACNVSNTFLTILGSVGLNQNSFVATNMPETYLRAKTPEMYDAWCMCVNSNALMSTVTD